MAKENQRKEGTDIVAVAPRGRGEMLAPFKKLDSLARSLVCGVTMLERHFESAISVHSMLLCMALGGCLGMPMLYEKLGGRDNTLFYWCLMAGCYLAFSVAGCYIAWGYNRWLNLKFRRAQVGALSIKMATTNPLVSLPVEIFCNILEYLDWSDVGRLDTAFLNRETRNSYLFALQLRKVKVERNRFWERAVDRGILSWLIRRNIRVISWDLQVDNTQLISIASGLPQLQSLIIWSCNITDEGIRAVASGLPQLQSLNISLCHITDEGIRTLVNGCPQLQSLDISWCGNITDEGIRALANGLPQLQSLNIYGCYKITDEGIRALASGLPQLQSLHIRACYNITDEGIRALANGCRQLQSLNIRDCYNITDEGIRALANGCRQLQSLNISGCKITDEGIRALASGLPQLQSLYISACYNITDEGIRALANGCPQLQSLNISACYYITNAGREIAERINSRRWC